MDMDIQEIIPVYLADGILLEDAIQFGTSPLISNLQLDAVSSLLYNEH